MRLNHIKMTDEVLYPEFEKIIKACKGEIKTKYKQYGNNWVKADNMYWQIRLKNEVEEYVNSQSIVIEKRKLINIINIAAMAHDTAIANRGCTQHEVDFDIIMKTRDWGLDAHCNICDAAVTVTHGIITETKNPLLK